MMPASTCLMFRTVWASRSAILCEMMVRWALRKYAISLAMASPLLPCASSPALVDVLVAFERVLELVEVLDHESGAAGDAGERVLGDPDGHVDLLADRAVDAADERAAAGHGDAALGQVGRELGGRLFQRLLDGVDDGVERLLHGLADLLAGDGHLAGHHGHDVAAADFEGQLLLEGIERADVDLDPLGGLLADLEVVGAAEVLHDRLVELVAGDADGAGGDDAAEGEDGDLGGAAADVDDHVADGIEHREAGDR